MLIPLKRRNTSSSVISTNSKSYSVSPPTSSSPASMFSTSSFNKSEEKNDLTQRKNSNPSNLLTSGTSNMNQQMKALVLYDYDKTLADELSISRHSEVLVLSQVPDESGWIKVLLFPGRTRTDHFSYMYIVIRCATHADKKA